MRNRAIHIGGALALVVMGALAAAGTAGAAQSRAAAVSVPAIAVRLHADLAPVGSATGSGRFDALLIRSGPGQVRAAGATLPGPRGGCPPNGRSGVPCVIGARGGFPAFSIPAVPPTGVHWMIVWRLALSGVAGPASASIHLGAQGAASPILGPLLCSSCQAVTTGHMTLTAGQAQLFLKGDGYVDVNAASGQLNGHIVVLGHFSFSAPVRRTSR